MFQLLKSAARDTLPRRLQVPVKYWYGRARKELEPEMALLSHLVRHGDHVADVGGNRGTYAYALVKLGASVEVFEPNPLCATILRDWARQRPGVQVHPVALSAASGAATLHVPIDVDGVEHDASASVEAIERGRTHDIAISTRPLDNFGFTDLSFIKIDTEGHETSVLAGAKATIAASSPALLIEIEQRHNPGQPITAIFERLIGLGYAGFYLRDGSLMRLATFDVDRDQSTAAFAAAQGGYYNNFLFLAEARLARGEYTSLFAQWMPR